MTKFIACKCPNCGANVKVDSNLEKATCKYCDADIIVERDMDQEIKKTINKQLKFESKVSKVVTGIVFSIFALVFAVIIGVIIYFAINGHDNDVSKSTFNFILEHAVGRRNGVTVKQDLNQIITSNKKYKDHQIYVIYNDKNTNKTEGIVEIRDSLKEIGNYQFYEYDVMIDYDDDGYINKYTINE